MAKTNLPLKEISIEQLYRGSDQVKYEIPVYQRNYAWEKEEISALIQDVYDAYKKNPGKNYYVGTLVSYYKGDNVYEIIDGQQRLTSIRIILSVLGIPPKARLTYKARRRSDETLKHLQDLSKADEMIGIDAGIKNGLAYAKEAYQSIVPEKDGTGFKDYFLTNVHLIYYKVPKDIDLNHYFEIMNSRGEQLEKHEIVKANLMEVLDRETAAEKEMEIFHQIWECCSEMSVYIQQNLKILGLFGENCDTFMATGYDSLKQIALGLTKEKQERSTPEEIESELPEEETNSAPQKNINLKLQKEERNRISIKEIIASGIVKETMEEEKKDSFQPIIDFSNFLLIVLKITLMSRKDFVPEEFNLDDKEILHEFDKAHVDPKEFIFNLLKARYLLDNYIVHHSKEEDTIDNNPWKLQKWVKDGHGKQGYVKGYARNLSEDSDVQNKLTHLLSMFEVSFTARQRKNYLFYCLFYLIGKEQVDIAAYAEFVEQLAKRYFHNVYLDAEKLNTINVPVPGAFDATILHENLFNQTEIIHRRKEDFTAVFGDGTEASNGIPLFVFNYLDYLIWKHYSDELRGERAKEGSRERSVFFQKLGCTDFGLKVFDQFYFSRTRRSLEHYYPQSAADGVNGHLNQDQINCLGNYAMIGSEANSSGSNWSPKTKLDHYLDSSGKISQLSVASLKFMIMMQTCRDSDQWEFGEICTHQEKMVGILLEY